MIDGNRDGPVGIGGWLAFFLFGFAFVSPLAMVFGTYLSLYDDQKIAELLGDRWGAYQFACWVLIGSAVAMIGYTTWRIFNRKNRQTVKITMAAIIMISLGVQLLDLTAAVLIGGFDARDLLQGMAPDLVRGAIYAVIWCAYFQLSVRIRNTYDDSRQDETAVVFE